MEKFDLKKLPKGFRFLFTLKEIKEIESFAGIGFRKVSNGNLTHSEKFDSGGVFQSSFTGFSIQGIIVESIWKFSFHQTGFRDELLPEVHEKQIKKLSSEMVKEYLNKIYNSQETDLYKNPELRAHIYIYKDKADVSFYETK
jgi:hypothetical protein